MSGFNLGSVGFVGSLSAGGGAVVVAPVTNRALVTVAGSQGLLPSNRATGFNLGTNWRLRVRLRQANATSDYVLAPTPDPGTGIALIWNFNAGIYEMYGPDDRFGLAIPVTDGLFHTVEFVYSGGVISGFLNGAAAGSKASAFFAGSVPATMSMGLGLVAQGRSFRGAYDSILLEIAGEKVIDLNFNEETGPATNAGTNGGVMSFTGGVTRELVP